MIQRKYGYIPSLGDHRDFKLTPPVQLPVFPETFSLRSKLPACYDQGQVGSCVWNALSACHEYEQAKQGEIPFMPSRLFGYYFTRKMEHTIFSDCGCQPRDAFKVVSKMGICEEALWAYDERMVEARPTIDACNAASFHKALLYEGVGQTQAEIQSCLYGTNGTDGYPVFFGSSIYDSFESPDTLAKGMVPMPSKSESCKGGHAEVIIGWKPCADGFRWEVRNSWGVDVADSGMFWFPLEYILSPDLTSDVRKLSLVE